MRLAALNMISKKLILMLYQCCHVPQVVLLCLFVCSMRFTGQTQCTVALLTDASSSLFAAATQRAKSASVYHSSYKNWLLIPPFSGRLLKLLNPSFI